MLQHSEQRNFIRMDIQCEMTYRYPDSPQIYVAVCKNLSGSGVLFTAAQAIEVGAALEIKLAPTNALTPPMKALVEVLRCRPATDGDGFDIAAEIKAITE